MNLGQTLTNVQAVSAEHLQRVSAAHDAIMATSPKTALAIDLAKVFGVVVFLAAFGLPKFLGFPIWVAVGVAGFGAFLAFHDLFIAYVTLVPKIIAAVLGAMGKTPPPPSS